MPACKTGFASSFRPKETKARPRPKCEAHTWVRVQLCGDRQVLDRFFEIAALLENFVTQSITTEKSFRILGDHLPKRVNVHLCSAPSQRIHYSIEGAGSARGS